MSVQTRGQLEQLEMEKALRRNEAMQRSLFEHAPDAIAVTDKNGLIFQVNAQAETIFGYSREELLGQSIDMLVPERVRKSHAGHRADYHAAPRTRPMGAAMNLTARRKDGSEVPVEISLSPCTQDGELLVIAIIRDVSSDRKRAEEALRLRHTLEIQSSLHEIGQTIINSTYLPTLLEEILDKTLAIGALDIGVIRLLDVESKMLKALISRGYRNPENLRPISVDPINPSVGKAQAEVFESSGACVVEGVPTCAGFRRFKKEGVESAVVVPVRAGEKIIGTMQLGSRTQRKFKPEDIRLFTAIGNQLGIAVQKSKLHETTLQNLERMRALQEINQATTSTLDMRAILDILLEKIELCLPYAVTTIRLVNRDKGILEAVVCRNLDEEEWKAATGNIAHQINRLLPTGNAPVYTRHVQTDPLSLAPEFLKKHGLVSSLRVPLLAKGETLGVITFFTKDEHEFTGEEIEFVSTLAGQAAIAIHNSQLYKDVQRREQQIQEGLKQLQALYAITTTANQSLDLDIVLNEVIRKVTEIFGFDATQIFIFDPSMQTLLLKASYQISPEPFVTENSFRRGQGIVGRAAEAIEPIIFEDIRNDPKYLEMSHMANTRRTGFRFLAAFPIKSKRQTLGAIAFFGHQPRSLIANEIELLTAMAGQIGIAVQNARLFEETAQRADDLTLYTLDLERANKVKDEFLSIMSHELRTPLNVMMGYTGLLKEGMFGRINPEQDDALAKVINQANDLLSILNNVLRATQIGSGLIKAKKAKVNLGDFLDELKIAYDVPMGKELTISWDYASDLPDAETDGEKLKHVLQNLINNAIKFTGKGQVRISARYLPQAKIVKFKVADTGIGITKESLPHIFDMFHQGDASDTRLHGGAGLGLYIVKKYTELLGGEVKVESEPGIGSVFTVVIPSQTQASTPKLNLAILEESR